MCLKVITFLRARSSPSYCQRCLFGSNLLCPFSDCSDFCILSRIFSNYRGFSIAIFGDELYEDPPGLSSASVTSNDPILLNDSPLKRSF